MSLLASSQSPQKEILLQSRSPHKESLLEASILNKAQLGTKVGLDSRSQQDPFLQLTSNQIDQYAKDGLAMFQQSLESSSSTSKFQQTLKNLEKIGRKQFTDLDFPPQLTSLVGENSFNRSNWKVFAWRRPSEFMDQSLDLFVGGIESGDIQQGKLGDCYFLSTLASLAERPERIKKMFKLTYDNKSDRQVTDLCKKYGVYGIQILDMGIPKEIIVDDYIPCLSLKQGPSFTKTLDNELWVLLVEKAWAKLYGSYNNIEAGLTRECLHDLTYAPTKTIWTDEEDLWKNIRKGVEENWPMTAGSNDDPNESVQANGIVNGHAYSLLAGYDIECEGKGVQLVKLRNPWGQKEFNGRWSDTSRDWDRLSSKTRNEINRDRKPNDGIFFMEFSEFRVNFSTCQFCLVKDNFKYSYKTAKPTNQNGLYFKVYLSKKGKYFFTVNHESKRKFSQKIQDNWIYPTTTIVVGKVLGEDKYQYIEGKQVADREVSTTGGENLELEAGQYIVYVKIQWIMQELRSFSLSVYGAETAEIYTKFSGHESNFLSSVYMDFARNKSTKRKNLAEKGAPNAFYCVDQTNDGFAFAACWNDEERKQVNWKFRVKNLKKSGMRIKGREYSGLDSFSFLFNPKDNSKKSEGIVLIRIKDYANEDAKLSFAQEISITDV